MFFNYECLDEAQKHFYRVIVSNLRCGCHHMILHDRLLPNKIESLIRAVQWDHPEFYYLNEKRIWYSYGTEKTEIHFGNEKFSGKECQNAVQKIEQWADDILFYLKISPGQESTYDICKKIHNFLIRYASYAEEAIGKSQLYPWAHSVEGVFRYRKAVCEGIAKTFLFLCRRAQVEVFLIEGKTKDLDSNDQTGHMWNLVKIGEEYVHIDVTWDLCHSQKCGCIRYDYFMIPDRWIYTDHSVSDVVPLCKTDQYTHFVRLGRIFSDVIPLCKYLRLEIRKNVSDIYFRLDLPDLSTPEREEVLMKTFSDILSRCGCRCSYILWSNSTQNVFLFRMQKGEVVDK